MDEATVVASHSAPETPAGKGSQKPHRTDPSMPVRSADLEPYTGLGYLSKLFKLMAAVLLLLVIVALYFRPSGLFTVKSRS